MKSVKERVSPLRGTCRKERPMGFETAQQHEVRQRVNQSMREMYYGPMFWAVVHSVKRPLVDAIWDDVQR